MSHAKNARKPRKLNELSDDELVDDIEAGHVLNVQSRTLKFWRNSVPRKGPPVTYIGRHVRYGVRGIRAFIASQTVTPQTPALSVEPAQTDVAVAVLSAARERLGGANGQFASMLFAHDLGAALPALKFDDARRAAARISDGDLGLRAVAAFDEAQRFLRERGLPGVSVSEVAQLLAAESR